MAKSKTIKEIQEEIKKYVEEREEREASEFGRYIRKARGTRYRKETVIREGKVIFREKVKE